jgi:hypothetical protein
MPVVEAAYLRPEAERKHQHPHTAPARDKKMPEFVKEHDDRQDE